MNNIDWYEQIEATGEWWHDPWWENPKYLHATRHPIERVRDLIEVLKQVFPAQWTKQVLDKPRQCVVMPVLTMRGHPHLRNLIRLGEIIESVRNAPGFLDVLQRLKGSESSSAYFELQIANAFAENNVQTEFPRQQKTKTPDILARCLDGPVEIECKYLHAEKWEDWERELTHSVIRRVTSITHRHDFGVQVKLNQRITDIRFDEERYPGFNNAVMTGIVNAINSIVVEKLQAGQLPTEFEIDGLMTGLLFLKQENIYSSVSGASISGVAKLRRIVTNAVYEAAGQLSGDYPGIVCVYSDHIPERGLARTVFDALTETLNERFSTISAVILFPMQLILSSHNPPLLLENRYGRHNLLNHQALKIIQSKFQPHIA
jgi:hypothetical protein